MRILELEIEGFGPFRDTQRLDFERAAAGGILLITGRTGAGKSSILDAISFALYGSVPRYDGKVGRVRSDHLAPDRGARVRLDFEMAGERFRIARTPEWERPKLKGEGTTVQKPTAELWRWDENLAEWEGLASRPVDVAALITPVLGLSHEQFLQVVLLAQGGFQRFLRAGDQERQATLRTLFRTERFAEVERLLAERRKALGDEVELAEARILGLLEQLESAIAEDRVAEAERDPVVGPDSEAATDPDSDSDADADPDPESSSAELDQDPSPPSTLPERREAVAVALQALAERVAVLAAESRNAREAHTAAEQHQRGVAAISDAQSRLAAARSRERELAERAPEIDGLRVRVSSAERAQRARPALKRWEEAGIRLERARADDRQARELLRARLADDPGFEVSGTIDGAGADPSDPSSRPALSTATELGALRDQATASLALLERAEATERELSQLRAEQRRLAAGQEELAAAGAELQDRAGALPGLLAEARAAYERVQHEASGRAERESDVERAEGILRAARELERLLPEIAAAEQRSAEAAAKASNASAAVSELLARRLAGMAGELASDLRSGVACAVCGSTEHPAPAFQRDPVSENEIAAAESVLAAAQAQYESERTRERELGERRAGALAGAHETSVESAIKAVDAQRAALRRAQEATADVDARAKALNRLETEQTENARGLSENRQRLATLTESAAAHERRARELDEMLVRDRGQYSSVEERRRATNEIRTLASNALDRLTDTTTAEASNESATQELAASIAEAQFDDQAEMRAALLPEPERMRIAEQIERHAAEQRRNEGVLSEPSLAGLPSEAAPIAEANERLEQAREASSVAAGAESAARERLVGREAQFSRIDTELERIAGASGRLNRLRLLADAAQGKEPNTRRMRLEAFVLAARLEAIVDAANLRLTRMVGGRYRLLHDDGLRSRGRQSGLGLAVLDEYTGRERSTDSLSGGETFLASLALALGLADVVTAESGGIRLDTLFIDEGFGTLDPDALDQALATLDALREGGRTVALISHVAELRERLPAQLEVIVDDRGVSALRGEGVIAPPNTQKEKP